MKMMMMNSKRLIFALVTMLTLSLSANAMSYEQARNEALFLTDKMAYELNLTDAQYEAAYEINLDYLMGVTSVDDVFGVYWERRNLDLSYILYSWQWDAFRAATYFYRPLFWEAGYWHFGIYARYPRRDYFYFGRPHFYATYRGGHAWHLHGTNGYYHSHASHFRPSLPAGRQHFGMRNSFDRGDFRGVRGSSSTRVTGRPDNRRNSFNNGGFNNRSNGGFGNRSNNFGDRQNSGVNNRNNGINSNAHGNFGGSRNFGSSQSGSASSSTERPARSVGNNSGVSNRSNSVNSNANGNFGGTRNFGSSQSGSTSRSTERPSRSFGNSSSAPSRSFGNSSSAPSRSIGSSSSAPSRSFGNSHSSVGGSRSSHSLGGSSMGGRSSSQGHSGGHGHFGGNRR